MCEYKTNFTAVALIRACERSGVLCSLCLRSLNTLSAARSAQNASLVIASSRICGIGEAIVCLS